MLSGGAFVCEGGRKRRRRRGRKRRRKKREGKRRSWRRGRRRTACRFLLVSSTNVSHQTRSPPTHWTPPPLSS